MVPQIPEFLENECQTTDFVEIQQVDELQWKMLFLIFLSQSMPLE